ncbi:MAG: Ig-like domain-containing protein [marine benthic group bacterium]|nr:Ig-like domain-containing protein [Gemmatimonadota bacterium]
MRTNPMVLTLVALVGLTACSGEAATGPMAADEVALVMVSPAGGTANVDPGSPVTVEFDHPMADGMEAYCALHQGGLNGTEVTGHWEWSENRHRLTFTPDEPYQQMHEYTLHVGGGMQDEHGHHMNFQQHGHAMGGDWVEEHMFGSGGGMMGGHNHMGDGWQHENGMYGMTFSFTTMP